MSQYDVQMKMTADMGAAVTELKKISTAMTGIADKTEDASKEARSFSDTLEDMSGPATKVFATMTAGITGATLAFASYEKELRNVQNISGETDKSMQGMTAQFMALPPTLGEADDLMRGLYQTISSGITDSEEAFGVVVSGAKAAKGNLADMEQTIDGLTSVLNSWKLEASESTAVLDAMTKTVDLGKLTFGELADNVGKASAIAAAAGVSYQELLATLATLTLNGLSVEESMTAIRAILTNTLSPAQQVTEAMEGMNVELSVSAIRSKGLGGMMADVANAVQGNAEATAMLFPNVRALNGAMALASEEGGAKLQQTLTEITNSAGKVESNFENMNRTMAASSAALVTEWKKVGIAFGETSSGLISETIGRLTELATVMKNLQEPTRGAMVDIALFVTGLSGIVIAAPKIIKGIEAIKAAAIGLNTSLGIIGAAAAAVFVAMEAYGAWVENEANEMMTASGIYALEMDALGVAAESAGFKISELVAEFQMQSGQIDATSQDVIDYIKHLDKSGKAAGKWATIVKVFNDVAGGQADAIAEVADATEDATDRNDDLLDSMEKMETAQEKSIRLKKEEKEAAEALAKEIENQTRYNAGLHLGMEDLRGDYEVINPLIIEQGEQTSYLSTQMGVALDRTLALAGGFGTLGGYVYGASGEIGAFEGKVEDAEDTVASATDEMVTSFSDMLGKGFTGEFETFSDLWTELWQDLAKSMTGSLFDGFADLFKEGGEGFAGLMDLFDTEGKSMGERIGTALGGAGMVYQSTQQERSTMSVLQGAMGGAMAGSMIMPGIGTIVGAVVGAAVAYFGGQDAASAQGTIGPLSGGLTRTRGQDLGEGAWDLWTRERQEEYRAAITGMTDTLRLFGDADLFDLVGDAPNWTFSGKGDLEHWAQIFREDWIPSAMEEMFGLALNQGLSDFGVTDATIDRLWRELGGMTGTAVTEGLRTYISAIVAGADLAEAMDFDQILEDAGQTPRSTFFDFMLDGLEQIDMAMLGWENMTLVEQAAQAREIQGLMVSVREAEIAYLRQIDQISEGIARSLGDQREGLMLGGMGDLQQAEYAGDQIADIFQQLMAGGLDPQAVAGLVGDAQGYIRMIEQLMGDEGLDGRIADVFTDFFGTSAFNDLMDLFPNGIAAGMTGRDFLMMLIDQLGATSEGALQEARDEAEVLNAAYLARLEAVNNQLLTGEGNFDNLNNSTAETKNYVDELGTSAIVAGTALRDLAVRLNATGVGGQTVINVDPNLAPLVNLIESIVAARTGGGGDVPPGDYGGIR